MKRNKITLLVLIFSGIFLFRGFSGKALAETQEAKPAKGIWVTVFSDKKVLYSKSAVSGLVAFCKHFGIEEIYLQLYQSGNTYYDSGISDRAKYEEILKTAKADTVDLLLEEAAKNNIKVFAWVNLLSLGQNDSAPILRKFGRSVLTKDQYLQTSCRKDPVEQDKYYLRDDKLFLEPGDGRVSGYLAGIVDEIITRYPSIAGVHLDYIRYPQVVPFIPGSRFNKYGLSYGYGQENIERFKQKTGFSPLTGLSNEEKCLLWDNWRRQQVTELVEKIAKRVREKSPKLVISCAVIPSAERAYSSLFQDWPLWLKEGIVDHVVLMNYTLDNELTARVVKSALAYRDKGKVLVGMGVFLMKNDPDKSSKQYRIINDLKPDGIVFFSYDDASINVIEHLIPNP